MTTSTPLVPAMPSNLADMVKEETVALVGWAIALFGGAAVGIQKIRRSMSADERAIDNDAAYGNIMNLMGAEIDRLSAQNAKLATLINTLQTEVITLRNENADLKTAFGRLSSGR